MRDELGRVPHLRGSVGISTRGRDTGDAQIFIDLLDLPRLDHDYTVFATVTGTVRFEHVTKSKKRIRVEAAETVSASTQTATSAA
jgi:cyclophilin family peptidyl-prolyl cis-trans isomerase